MQQNLPMPLLFPMFNSITDWPTNIVRYDILQKNECTYWGIIIQQQSMIFCNAIPFILPDTQYFQNNPWLKKGRPCHGVSQWAPWQGIILGRQSFHPLTRARRPPYLFRSRREEDKGYACRGQRKQRPCSSAADGGHGTEAQPADPWPLEARERQCSRHAGREHRRPVS